MKRMASQEGGGGGGTGGRETGRKGGGRCTGGGRRGGGKRDSQGGGKREKKGKITQHCAIFRNRRNAKGREPKNTGREPGLKCTGSGRFNPPVPPPQEGEKRKTKPSSRSRLPSRAHLLSEEEKRLGTRQKLESYEWWNIDWYTESGIHVYMRYLLGFQVEIQLVFFVRNVTAKKRQQYVNENLFEKLSFGNSVK